MTRPTTAERPARSTATVPAAIQGINVGADIGDCRDGVRCGDRPSSSAQLSGHSMKRVQVGASRTSPSGSVGPGDDPGPAVAAGEATVGAPVRRPGSAGAGRDTRAATIPALHSTAQQPCPSGRKALTDTLVHDEHVRVI